MANNNFNQLRDFVSELETANDGTEAMRAAILEAMDILDGDKASSNDDNGE